MRKKNQPQHVQTCASHPPGSMDCGPSCPNRLIIPGAGGSPGIAIAFADGTRDTRAAEVKSDPISDVARAMLGKLDTVPAPEVGPESTEEMEEAVEDIKRRDEQADEESDEGEADIDGDELDDEARDAAAKGRFLLEMQAAGFSADEAARALSVITGLR
jgi:hypothetical protein